MYAQRRAIQKFFSKTTPEAVFRSSPISIRQIPEVEQGKNLRFFIYDTRDYCSYFIPCRAIRWHPEDIFAEIIKSRLTHEENNWNGRPPAFA
jgi:hypothetical protein